MIQSAPSRLRRLSRDLPSSLLSEDLARAHLPERVLQFGEGNFLRAFVDWMLSELNRQGKFRGRAVVVQPIAEGLGEILNDQDGLYTVLLRGMVAGKPTESRQVVEAVSRCINPYSDHEAWLATARSGDIRFVVSNTTEAGIALDPEDAFDKAPSPSYPAKLTQWLYARYEHFSGAKNKGVVVLPCELIENNGHELRKLVLELCSTWQLSGGFRDWIQTACVFTNTLVDRIVTGYPRSEAGSLCEQFGYEDRLIVAGEVYHCWVIESPQPLEDELPLKAAGLNVVWTRNALPYRERKVRILNGAHTAMTMVGLLAGLETVGDCMKDPLLRNYIEGLLQQEICPTLEGEVMDNAAFAATVLERFENPYVRHELGSIALNSVSKFRARLLGSFGDYLKERHALPRRLCLALGALLVLYRDRNRSVSDSDLSLRPKDEPRIIELLETIWRDHAVTNEEGDYAPLVRASLSEPLLWGEDLTQLHPNLVGRVADEVADIVAGNIRQRLEAFA